MKQKMLDGRTTADEEKLKKYGRWVRCPNCDRKVYEGRGHNCKPVEKHITFDDLNVRK